tara:strand:+ start:1361 stop:1708 length:348 start_codon:yes stop_codon:yes gene_type:complete
MDERLQKALEFSNYTATINNQKRNIKNRFEQLQLVHFGGGVFIANHETISFIKTMIEMDHTTGVLIDSKENPINVKSFRELLERLMDAYFSATTEYEAEYAKIRKARNIKSLMDW